MRGLGSKGARGGECGGESRRTNWRSVASVWGLVQCKIVAFGTADLSEVNDLDPYSLRGVRGSF